MNNHLQTFEVEHLINFAELAYLSLIFSTHVIVVFAILSDIYCKGGISRCLTELSYRYIEHLPVDISTETHIYYITERSVR